MNGPPFSFPAVGCPFRSLLSRPALLCRFVGFFSSGEMLSVYTYVCMLVCMYVCMRVTFVGGMSYELILTDTRLQISCACVHVCIYEFVYLSLSVSVCMFMFACLCLRLGCLRSWLRAGVVNKKYILYI
jgi:hypothetical protein